MENKKIKCPVCNIGFLETITSDYSTVIKDGQQEVVLTISNLKRENCPNCNEEFLGPEALKIIEDAKYKQLGLLTPDELRMIREKLGLTQEQISSLLGVGKKSYFRWENGLSIQNKSIDRYIRLVNENPKNILVLLDLQKQKAKDFRKDKIAPYFEKLKSIEDIDTELVGCVGYNAEVTKEEIEKIEEVIKKHQKE